MWCVDDSPALSRVGGALTPHFLPHHRTNPQERGYLFLASAKGETTLRANHQAQRYVSFIIPPSPRLSERFGSDPLLWLTHGWSVDTRTHTHNIFRDAGVDWVDLLSPPQLQREFPWLALGDGKGGSGTLVCLSDGLVCG